MGSDDVSISPQECNTEYIYDTYKKCIAHIIAYIEVYEHDLPGKIMTQIAELFQMLAIYETSPQNPPNSDIAKTLFKVNLKVTQSLHKHAICLFINKIQQYKKNFRRFNYKGAMLDEQNFAETANRKEKEIAQSFTDKLAKCYSDKFITTLVSLPLKEKLLYLAGYVKFKIFRISSFSILKSEPYLPIDNLINDCMDDINFVDTYEETRQLLELYEKARPKVISSKARQSFGMSVFIAVCSWIIPIILVLPFMIRVITALITYLK